MALQKNKVKYGLNKVHYAKITSWSEEGVPTFATPVRLPGAVSLSVDANGEQENFYADDGVYYVLNNNAGYDGELEIALITTDFATTILGELLDRLCYGCRCAPDRESGAVVFGSFSAAGDSQYLAWHSDHAHGLCLHRYRCMGVYVCGIWKRTERRTSCSTRKATAEDTNRHHWNHFVVSRDTDRVDARWFSRHWNCAVSIRCRGYHESGLQNHPI